jgi:Flp pilus assembly protein TadG
LVEFVFLLPVLMLLVFAIFEFGNMFRVQVELQNAVREGSHFMAINDSTDTNLTSDVQAKVQARAADLSSISVTSCYPTTGSGSCSSTSPCSSSVIVAPPLEVQVSATYAYTPITPFGYFLQKFGGSLGSSISLSASSTAYDECA